MSPFVERCPELRLIFWGSAICFFDLSIGQTNRGSGFRCDLINDVVGAVLIIKGVLGLRNWLGRFEPRSLNFTLLGSWIALAAAFLDFLIIPWPPVVGLLLAVVGTLPAIAMAVLTACLRRFCESNGWIRAAESWRVTTILALVFLVGPSVLAVVVQLVNLAARSGVLNNNQRAAVMLSAVAFLVGAIVTLWHFLVSTRRFERRWQERSNNPGGFSVIQ